MAGLGQTVAAITRFRDLARRAKAEGTPRPASRMVERVGFGKNPGALHMFVHVPEGLPEGAPLVVVLHGCSQQAEAYAIGAGWLALADRLGFVVVAPEQSASNNPNRCFNWFEAEDVRRGHGEVASIRQMVATAIADHHVDPARVFVTGLSAGGAMTSAMLAAYPEVFAAGAVVAGLPYRAAEDMMQAFGAMFQPAHRPAHELGELVRRASRHHGPWPRVSIWHGDADSTVQSANAGEIAKQWTDVHGLAGVAPARDRVDGQWRSVWAGADGRPMVESYTVAGLGHGTPLAAGGPEGLGAAGAYLLEAGISSTRRIAEFWGLTDETEAPAAADPAPIPAQVPAQVPAEVPVAHPHFTLVETPPRHGPAAIEEVITKALTAAGLMKR